MFRGKVVTCWIQLKALGVGLSCNLDSLVKIKDKKESISSTAEGLAPLANKRVHCLT